MSEETEEKTTGGLVGKVTGKAKELAGELTDNDELAREGRLQQAGADAKEEALEEQSEARLAEHAAAIEQERAETEQERQRVEGELEAARIEQHAEADREEAEHEAIDETAAEIKRVEAERQAKHEQADRLEREAIKEGS